MRKPFNCRYLVLSKATQPPIQMLFWILGICITICICMTVCDCLCNVEKSAINDDFCDCDDGSDELNTSACSHLSPTFKCLGGLLNDTIPTSRVNDGICDCCDGSDEYAHKFSNCSNYCEESLAALRYDALALFRTVQAGRRARAELIHAEKRKKLLELKNYESLQEEKVALSDMYIKIKLWMRREEPLEDKFRVRLIRERESRCGFGEEEACELFHKGWLPNDKIATEGLEALYANPKYTLHHFPTSEQLAEQRRLSGIARVRYSLCMESDLQPDQTMRIFDTMGEYESFYSSPGAKVAQRKSVGQMRRESLFGAYLEHGHRGHMEALAVIAEFLGLLFSPISVPIQLSYMYFQHSLSLVGEWLEQCAQNGENYSAIQWSCIYLSRVDPKSTYQRISNALDITLFNEIQMYAVELVSPFIAPPIWLFSVMWGTPRMYYEYYWLELSKQLPVRRECCLLREAETSVLSELEAVTTKIEEFEAKQKQRVGPATTASRSSEYLASISKPAPKSKSSKASKDSSVTDIDFGQDGTWELVNGECLEATFGKYKYKYCFFSTVKQGSTLLGNFLGWGHRADLIDSRLSEVEESGNKKKVKPTGAKWAFPDGYAERRARHPDYYTTQVYTNGAICQGNHNLGGRITEVEFICGTSNAIVDVIETEMCVYWMQIRTPIACSDDLDVKVTNSLSDLKIFGFSSIARNAEIEVNAV